MPSFISQQLSSTAVFCADCHSIMSLPDHDEILRCLACPFTCRSKDVANVSNDLSRPLEADHSYAEDKNAIGKEVVLERATVEEACPNCEHDKLYFYTMQMRSVDEGSTVFYECPKCKHKFSVNN